MIASATPTPALEDYARSLDLGAASKAARIRPWLQTRAGSVVVDVGTAGGGVAAALARALPDVHVIGTDACAPLLELASARHAGQSHLTYVYAPAAEPVTERATAVVMGAVLHEIFSSGGDLFAPIERSLAAAYRMLAPGGTLVIRDFVRPADAARRIVLEHRDDDVGPGRSFGEFAAASPRRVELRRARRGPGHTCYETTLGDAYEYLFRKDAAGVWEQELAERYGFWTAEDAARLVTRAGFAVHEVLEFPHRWVVEHRLHGRARVLDPDMGAVLPAPMRQLLLVAHRAA